MATAGKKSFITGMIQMSTPRHCTFWATIGQGLVVAMLATIHSPR
ncbi:hypothetical protein [Bradyrhizobium sp. C-145]|nr:hypothetical protein [Bradyrhizobium sp. C-145]